VFKEDKKNDLVTLNDKNIWTDYKNAQWSDNYNGLKIDIQKVFVTDKGDKFENGNLFNGKTSYIGFKFKMQNITDGTFSAYPDEVKLITSNGEEISDHEIYTNDDFDGDMGKGDIKEGNIVWNVKNGNAEDIKWVKIEWNVYKDNYDNATEDVKSYSVYLSLVK
jgi:hypothetical protein